MNVVSGPSLSNSNSCSNANLRKRTAKDLSSPPKKKKHRSKTLQENAHESSSDIESDEEGALHLMDPIRTPTFHGRRLTNVTTNYSSSNKLAETDNFYQRMETKYLMPLLVCQERLEKMINLIYKNQKKIQKALNKQQVLL